MMAMVPVPSARQVRKIQKPCSPERRSRAAKRSQRRQVHGCGTGDDLAVQHFRHPVAAFRQRAVMGDEQQRCAVLRAEVEEQLDDLLARHMVEVAGGLVRDDDLGTRRKCARNRHALLLAARKLAGIMRQAVAEAHPLQLVLGDPHRILGAAEFQRHGHILQRRHGGDQVEGLEHDADIVTPEGGKLVLALAGQRLSGDHHLAPAGALEPGDHHQQRGLAGTRRPDDAQRLARLHRQVHAAQDLDIAGAARQGQVNVLEGDGGGGHCVEHGFPYAGCRGPDA